MHYINNLIDQAINRANLPSDYALAKALGISQANITGWRKGKRHPSDEEAVQLATLAGQDEMQVIAAIHYETATTEKKKEFWKCYLESRGIAATFGCVALGVLLIATPEPAQASVLHLQNYDAPFCAHNTPDLYIMRISENKPSSFRLLICKAICYKVAALLKSFLNTKHRYAFP